MSNERPDEPNWEKTRDSDNGHEEKPETVEEEIERERAELIERIREVEAGENKEGPLPLGQEEEGFTLRRGPDGKIIADYGGEDDEWGSYYEKPGAERVKETPGERAAEARAEDVARRLEEEEEEEGPEQTPRDTREGSQNSETTTDQEERIDPQENSDTADRRFRVEAVQGEAADLFKEINKKAAEAGLSISDYLIKQEAEHTAKIQEEAAETGRDFDDLIRENPSMYQKLETASKKVKKTLDQEYGKPFESFRWASSFIPWMPENRINTMNDKQEMREHKRELKKAEYKKDWPKWRKGLAGAYVTTLGKMHDSLFNSVSSITLTVLPLVARLAGSALDGMHKLSDWVAPKAKSVGKSIYDFVKIKK